MGTIHRAASDTICWEDLGLRALRALRRRLDCPDSTSWRARTSFWSTPFWAYVGKMEVSDGLEPALKTTLEQSGYRGNGQGAPLTGGGDPLLHALTSLTFCSHGAAGQGGAMVGKAVDDPHNPYAAAEGDLSKLHAVELARESAMEGLQHLQARLRRRKCLVQAR